MITKKWIIDLYIPEFKKSLFYHYIHATFSVIWIMSLSLRYAKIRSVINIIKIKINDWN